MAFNPFHSFRKHKKVLFAGLTIMVMIVFIGSAGSSMSGGDILSSFSRAFGGRGRTVDVANVDGKGVSREELIKLRMQRKLANQFMAMATSMALQARQSEVQSALGPQANQQQLRVHLEMDPTSQQLISRLQGGGQGLYFAGGLSSKDLLDFLVWKEVADKLGINLSDADVNREIARLTLGKFSNKDSARLDRFMRSDSPEFRGIWSPELLMTGLRDEFRVRMAQEAMGYVPGVYGADGKPLSPIAAALTPYEFKQFYDDNTMKIDVGLIPVKVEDFVAKVTDKPDEKELKELFMKYRDVEYNPESSNPGFKQPKRVQIEWISARADAPVFKKLAQDMVQARRAGNAVAAALGSAASGAGPFAVGVDGVTSAAFDLELIGEYEGRKGVRFLAPSWTKEWRWFPPYPVHESSLKQRTAIAGAVGNAFGVIDSGLLPFAALGSYEAGITQQEITDRVKFGSTWIANGTLPTPLATAALAVYGTPKEEYLPFSSVKGWLQEQLETENLRRARNYVMETIMKEVSAIAKAKDQKLLDAYLADKVKEYGLETGKSAPISGDYTNRFTLLDDPGLKPLKDASLEAPSLDPTGRRFDRMMTGGSGTYQPRQIPINWESADRAFSYWQTADKKESMVPMDSSKIGKQVRETVEKAWKFNKARELAKKEAERLLDEARKEKGDVKALRDFSKRTAKKDLVEVGPIGRFNRMPSIEPTKAYRYVPPRIPDSKVPYSGEIPRNPFNPQDEPPLSPFAEKVIDLRKKGKGDGAVVADRPEATYYVAMVTNVLPPSDSEFYEAYKDAASQAQRRDPLMSLFEYERREKYQKEFMERLRAQYKLKIEDDKIKDLDDRSPGSGSEE